MSKTLIIFPGAGSPSVPLYKKVYNLIKKGAHEYGYASVDTFVRWPGQFDDKLSQTMPSLSFDTAVDSAVSVLQSYEAGGDRFDILGRSFGTFVALKSVMLQKPKSLGRLILWGAPAYWRLWQGFVQDFPETQLGSLDKKVNIEPDFFVSLEPVESLLGKITYSCVMASGTLDKNTTPKDMAYFRSLANDNVEFRKEVEGAAHEVTEDDPPRVITDYFSALFAH